MKVISQILPKIVCHGNAPSEKLVRIENTHTNTFHLVKKIVKIGSVDIEVALLNLKERKKDKKLVSSSKRYIIVGLLIGQLLFINVYLPCVSSDDQVDDLNVLQTL